MNPTNKTNRRHFLQTSGVSAVGASLGLTGCGDSSESVSTDGKPFAGQTLRVFVYSGAWEKGFRESFVPIFEKKTGATVIPDPGWWDSIPKLKASPPDQPAFDLVLTDATQGYPAIDEGMFQQLDFSKIPNVERMPASVLDNRVAKDRYGITFPESVMTLGYNRTLLDSEPMNWGNLMDEKVSGKLGLYNSFYMSLYTLACMKVASEGRPGEASAEVANNLQGVIDFARSQRDRVKLWWPTSTDMALNLAQKNCALGNMHSSDMLIALRDQPDLELSFPRMTSRSCC